MTYILDLSHSIRDGAPCTFGTVDKRPKVTFEEGESHAFSFVTSRIDNLHSNTCTHIDFPGHLHGATRSCRPIGEYPITRFVGKVMVLDFSYKLVHVLPYFNEAGILGIDPRDETSALAFLNAFDKLEITELELVQAISAAGGLDDEAIGILLYTGHSRLWKYQQFDSWQYLYFYNPYLSTDAVRYVHSRRLSFVGIDTFQLEHPITNFRGDELPIVLHKTCRDYVTAKLDSLSVVSNHEMLLTNDVLIYENLNIPPNVVGCSVEFSGPPLNFQIEGLDDNAIVRPYALVGDRK